ncbi:V-type proton ATPase 116 kDa subunit a-like isoform X2 [Thrips palmi]|uniref:V-type proton ATPase subunit a n=1 Tax=Thrips palmi TaxID=161013 RepID=A0A6P8ZA17_THRPL|nr:V-type proton ATPase 116 kDa subunit a-like isoform X2 [Thrips palmi]
MGAMFRSEEMALCQLFIQPEAAYSSVSTLGEMGIAQFRDMNPRVNPFMRKFVSEVRRCDELERKLRFIEEELKKDDVKVPEPVQQPNAPNPREIIDLEAHLEKTETEMLELSQNGVNLRSNFKELKEMTYVLEKAQTFMDEQEESDSNRALIGADERGRLGFIAGVIPREKVNGFERMLWRVSRGNVFLRQAEIDQPLEDPATGQQIRKNAFVAFFQGEQLKSRLKKICTGYHASLYTCPSSLSEREAVIKELRVRVEDLNVVLSQTMDHRQRVLAAVAKQVRTWAVMVRKMKAIYHTLNMFNMDVTNKCLIGECWVPRSELNRVRGALEAGGKSVGSTIDSFVNILITNDTPPTFIRTNKFTQGFQTLIDSYAVGAYREVNPAAFTVITFPFLFSVMFGDLGHGIIVALFGAYMCFFEKSLTGKKWGEIWDIFFGGRYIILLMGIFSIYSGILYNDIFSLSFNIFGSGWHTQYNMSTLDNNPKLTLSAAEDGVYSGPYFMGLDPAWQTAENKIIFLNSFKMKFSVIVAIIHMTFGICLSVCNFVHMKNKMNILLDFLPQVMFLMFFFGYLGFLIILKFFLYESNLQRDPAETAVSSRCAPSVLISFINMVLLSENPEVVGCSSPYLFAGQHGLQTAFVLIALLCIPVLLLAKPLYIYMKRRKPALRATKFKFPRFRRLTEEEIPLLQSNGHATQAGPRASSGDAEALQPQPQQSQGGGGHGHEEDEPFSEIMVHQAIHTVEYVLSTVSHTASYLRLWALSLAHAQLSDVLWTMIFRRVIKIATSMSTQPDSNTLTLGNLYGGIAVYIVFTVWVFFTVAVLVLMEGLSAFLHTLRLHWVEFMSKFYMGTGYAFEPFSFKRITVDNAE